MGLKHLGENEKLLARQSIKAPKHIDREAVKYLYAQKTNRTILGTGIKPLVSLYYGIWGTQSYDQEKYIAKRERVEKKFDSKIAGTTSQKKINNYQFRKQKKVDRLNSFIENGNLWMQWGEPVAVFDSASVLITEERIHDYLHANGYFTNKVISEVKVQGLRDRIVEVEYILVPGQPYHIDSIIYDVPDTAIVNLLYQNSKASYLRKGQQYKQDNLTRERERIDLMLKDNGYYDFSRQYIEYETDSVNQDNERLVWIKMIINEPLKRGYHKKFKIDSIQFTTDASLSQPGIPRQSRTYRDIKYQYYNDDYNLKILSQRVFIRPGEFYNRTKTLNTQRQLANVDAFKFINMNFDTAGGNFKVNIFSSPLPRYEWSNEAGVNVTQGYPGPFYSISFRKRNIFNGLENFELNGRFGFEGVASAANENNIYKSTEAGINASLSFPQFIFPFRERTRFILAQYNPKTRFTTGYSYTSRPEYTRTSVSLNGTYTWQNNKNLAYSLTPFSVSLINSDPEKFSNDFRELLENQREEGNLTLWNSFRPSFVNSVIFGFIWNQNSYGNVESNSSFLRVQLESGGTIWNVVKTDIVTDAGLEYFKYFRFSTDVRRINVLNTNTTLAYRLNGGLAYSYGKNRSLPYEKFFFAGGSNSIRAWRPRRLGPGSFRPKLSETPDADGLFSYRIEQPGDILLETSIELRKKLFGFVSGALFLDAGNIWTFDPRAKTLDNQEINSGNSQFRLAQFYKEIALGTGFGLRFDFTFLILRFDVGVKVIDPAREPGERFVLDQVRFWRDYATKTDSGFTDFKEPVIYNVGIGYSF